MVKEYTVHRRARDLFQKTMLSFSKPEPSLQKMASGQKLPLPSFWCPSAQALLEVQRHQRCGLMAANSSRASVLNGMPQPVRTSVSKGS
mmetsp:Transcript_1503/g.2631  ORF Transcript_1503/g.2631 Transcript_1503/m.2631 type:complete len:89 (-) Transcript_1503:79-345(-)